MENSPETKKSWVTENFDEFTGNLNGASKNPFHKIRQEALQSFKELGFPTPKDEKWKYTNVSTIEKSDFSLADGSATCTQEQVDKCCAVSGATERLVFVDGAYSAELSSLENLAKGVACGSLASVLGATATSEEELLVQKHLGQHASYKRHSFVALNTAFTSEGAYIFAKEGVASDAPIHLLFVTTDHNKMTVTHPRVIIIAAADSSVCVVEHHLGLGKSEYLTSAVTEVVVEERANVTHFKLQEEGEAAYHVSTIEVCQAEESDFATHSFSFGGQLVRNEINPTINGENCNTRMNGLNVLVGSQHVDNHTVIDHAVPNCESIEQYKGIYCDKSKGVFNGTIIVRQDAQKTNAIQSNQSVLLSRDAESNSQPQLKIWADDVRCTHGATIGELDDEAMFYLRSRGISADLSKRMLLRAFAGEVVEQVELEPLKDYVYGVMDSKLS